MVDGVASSRWVFGGAASATRAAAAPNTISVRMELLEQVVERFFRARGTRWRGRGLGFAFDGGSRLEVRALVACVLRRYARGHGPVTFEGRARVEVAALKA